MAFGADPGAGCGYFYLGQAMRVTGTDGRTVDLVLSCAQNGVYDDRALPAVGSMCRITYRVWSRQGILYEPIGDRPPPNAPMPVVRTLDCEPILWPRSGTTLDGATITAYGPEPRFDCGLVHVGRLAWLRTRKGKTVEVVLSCATRDLDGDGKPLPAVGAVCRVAYRVESPGRIAVARREEDTVAEREGAQKVVTALDCR